MNPHYDVIVDGLLKRLAEQGNKREDFEYVLDRVLDQMEGNPTIILPPGPPEVCEACCDPREFDDRDESVKLSDMRETLENIASYYDGEDPDVYFNLDGQPLYPDNVEWFGTCTIQQRGILSAEPPVELEPSVFFNFSE